MMSCLTPVPATKKLLDVGKLLNVSELKVHRPQMGIIKPT